MPAEEARLPGLRVRSDKDGDAARLQEVINLFQISQWRSNMFNEMRAMYKVKLHACRRLEVFDLDRMGIETALTADRNGSRRHVYTHTADAMYLIHGFQTHAKAASDVEPACLRSYLQMFLYRTNSLLEHPQAEMMKQSFFRFFNIYC